jgi:hypothetical protein
MYLEPKERELKGGWRKLHKEGLHDFYSLSDITSVVKLCGMEWAGSVARM